MVVVHLLDPDVRDLGRVDATVIETGHRVVIRIEDESVRAAQVDGELAGPIGGERVAVAWHAAHVSQSRGRAQRRQTHLEDLPLFGPPASGALAVVGA